MRRGKTENMMFYYLKIYRHHLGAQRLFFSEEREGEGKFPLIFIFPRSSSRNG
jgi:hypothetical protein